ncbi:MAG: sigma-54 dependent transcriptional regulator [Hyphomicrobiales bacterium]
MNTGPAKHVLLIEDDATLNRLLCDQIVRLGYSVTGVRSISEVDAAIQAAEPALVLLDIRLPDSKGMESVARFRDLCPVIVITAFGSVDQAVEAVREGAVDYLVKPISTKRLEFSVNKALATETMRRRIEVLETRVRQSATGGMVGSSTAFREVARMIDLVAPADTTVLILGESGVGKELVAQSIHLASQRHERELVTVDCATLHENLLESELFGHERGAFTGADRKKEGLIEVADGGTVFLDEVGEVSPVIQAKLLRVLESSRFRRLGGTRDISVDVRFITATNRNLAEMVKEGKFRDDLYYRLSPFVITVPPLRERKPDILPLANHFLDTRSFMRKSEKVFSPATEAALKAYHWPGNIRELRNVVERGLLMSAESLHIDPEHLALPAAVSGAGNRFVLTFGHEPTLEEVKAAYTDKMLALHHNNRSGAAKAMGVSERNLYRKIVKT